MTRKRAPRRRSSSAAALRLFKPKIVTPRKGSKAYRRKPKHPAGHE